jgi:iron(III) transport system permease protein
MTDRKLLSKKRLNSIGSYFAKPANTITIAFLIALCLLVLLPLISLLKDAFFVHDGEVLNLGKKAGTFTFEHWRLVLADGTFQYSKFVFWQPLFTSVLMALLSCVIAVGLGGTVAWFITRSNLPAKKFISWVFVFPYVMPSWSIAMFWENFFKNSNILACYNQVGMLESITGICVPEWALYGFFPAAMCLGIHYAPFAYILIGGILRNMDANLEEAATILKASRGKILRKITLPIVMPALVSTVLLVFASSISSYTVPTFLNKNGSLQTISTTMKSLLNSQASTGQGFVVAIVLLLFSVGIMTLNNWYTGKRKSFTTVTGKSGQISMVNLKWARIPITVLLLIIIVFIAIVPLVSFALESFIEYPTTSEESKYLTDFYWTTTQQLEPRIVGDSSGILHNPTIWKAIGTSVLLSLCVALIAGTCGILVGYAVARKRGSKLATFVSNLAFFPYLIPAMSFGAVYLSLAYTPALAWLNGSFIILLLVGGVKFLPFASRSGTNAMLQLSGEIEEAAIIMGVPWHKRMLRVLFPIQKSSFMSGYLLPFISSMRELTLFVLLAAPGSIITIVLGDFQRNGQIQIANGINFIIISIVLIVQFLANKLTGASLDKGIGG